MAKDFFHGTVQDVLLNEGFAITHDPYVMRKYDPQWELDFGAEKVIAAESGFLKIAVEVKSYFEDSFAHAFHGILGQYLNYRLALDMVEPDRKMLLAVPEDIYLSEFSRQGIRNSIHFYDVRLIVYNPIDKTVLRWGL
ncbi:MAG: fatty-acid oxidation protein subunit alpha [Saprospiraceae bacterium]|nr:fatty-acid oxidation protein subunit alpha [Saprospiraceae bacterium]